MSEFRIGNFYYKAGKLSADDQGDVYFKLLPVITSSVADIFPLVAGLVKSGEIASARDLLSMPLSELSVILPPIGDAVGKWKPEDRKFVIHKLLSCVERKPVDGTWSPVWNVHAGMSMFDDINKSFALQLQIAWQSLVENLGDFFTEIQLGLAAE